MTNNSKSTKHHARNPIQYESGVLELLTGERVHVERFNVTETYPELLEGRPTLAMNEQATARAKSFIENHFYGPPPVVVNPIYLDDPRIDHHLPGACCCARLNAYRPLKGGSCGSWLNVIWFGSFPTDVSIGRLIVDALGTLDWDSVATGYDL